MAKRTASRTKGSTGIFLGEDRLVVTTLRRRSVRARKLESFEHPVGPDGLAAALRELAEAGRLASEVVCGLDSRRIFSVTRLLDEEQRGREPSDLLSQQLTSFEGGVVAAMQPVKLPSGTHHHLVAVPRNVAVSLHDALSERSRASQRFVPTPVALMHLARRGLRNPRRWRASLRVLSGDEHGVVVLCHDDTAIAWRLYDPADRESLHVALLGLRSHAQDELGLARLDGLLLHLGDASQPLADELAARFELPHRLGPELRVDASSMSHALALSGLRPQWEDLDLFSDLRPHGGFRHNFPSRVVPALLLLIAGLSSYLWFELDEARTAVARVKAQIQRAAGRAGADTKGLKALHERRAKEMRVAEAFVVKRVFWEDYLRELPEVVPDTMVMRRFAGRDVVVLKDKAADVLLKLKNVAIAGDVLLQADEQRPDEVEQLTDALRTSELFQRDFPRVKGSDVRLQSGARGAQASIAVTCEPSRLGSAGL